MSTDFHNTTDLDNAREPTTQPVKKDSFAEVALRLGGASADEAKRTGVLDTADDEVEALFAPRYQTVNSPVHRAVWAKSNATEDFSSLPLQPSPSVALVVEQSLTIVRKHRNENTLFGEDGKITTKVIAELGSVGYWGLLVDREYGGSGASMREFTDMITRMATIDPTVAGLASVHGCIGAVDPVRSFGNKEQKQRFLPTLADGRTLSAFALTEPGAGSDLTALKTTAVLEGDEYIVNGEKLFITNAVPGRTIGLVCMIENVPSVLIVDLPATTDETFSLNRYDIYALRRAHNNGLVFRNFCVPKENRLMPIQGDGLTIAYHGLNLGRVSLCANAAGAMRWMMSEMLPWAAYRETYGLAIERRELIRRRIGRMAGMIVACDALSAWCAGLLDQGYRGEMECIIAKIFGSEMQKEAAIELFMKTHGGRSFLKGHLFGDNVHDFLAPCIYEGEGEVLGMAFFKSMVKHHGKEYFEPIGHALHALGVSKPNPLNPKHAWALRRPLFRYAGWFARQTLRPANWRDSGVNDSDLQRHVRFARKYLSDSGMKVSSTMRTYQLKLADRQCRMSALSLDIQSAVVMLVTSLYAGRSNDAITRTAGDVICRELRLRMEGGKPSDRDFRNVTGLGARIAAEGWSALDGVQSGKIMMPYK
ncbi:alkylation response protein AidB-like acyl-CoA dehydrogenase [Rhodopirellula rubra]|uniref:Alkylation response protein AidB-like acyl-CoA dehydrogenase n=1 Tax=Aporhodopirellula rubra TaxID=980271 RepID=A0A7W5E3S2_9BACT|nr:acyl-CoA dehydrogenase family protein [Aporhodopirellula rubra]MBB3209610.1 alkylation response protein AidB-like acyl-CoA dehydrogenase [Aporhodopirellula rubra]